MKIQIDLSKEPHECCPSFDVCSCNKCPLHKDYSKLKDTPEDKAVKGWRKCRSSKATRMKIALAFKSKNKGLTLRELSGMAQSIKMKSLNFSTKEKNVESPQDNIILPVLEPSQIKIQKEDLVVIHNPESLSIQTKLIQEKLI